LFPFHLNLGFKVFYFYEGFYFMLAILIAALAGIYWIKKHNSLTPYFFDLLFVGLLFALIGTRLFHFLFWNFDLLIRDPLVLLRPWEGGASIVGGIAGAFISTYTYCKIKKYDFFKYIALSSPALLLGQALGRIGCFLNGDAAGIATNLPWAVRFPRYGHLLPGGEINTLYSSSAWTWSYNHGLVDVNSQWSAPLHPTQLYESFLDLLLMGTILLVWKLFAKSNARNKLILLIHLGGYSLIRFMLEFIRQDREQVVLGNMSVLQYILIAVALVCTVLGFVLIRRDAKPQKISV
jgi:phosphatidylglycerol:prolipoprotein diacylglycerol transferase